MITKARVVEILCSTYRIQPSEVVYFDDLKEQTRHCCLEFPGIIRLYLSNKPISINGNQLMVPHFFCVRCSKLLVYKEIL